MELKYTYYKTQITPKFLQCVNNIINNKFTLFRIVQCHLLDKNFSYVQNNIFKIFISRNTNVC